MYLVITNEDLNRLKPKTRAELLSILLSEAPNPERFPRGTDDYGWDDRVDLTEELVAEFVEGCAPETVRGLRVIAEEGPIIAASELQKVGIVNYTHFQGRTTKRIRTVTGNKDAYFLAWDDWASEDNQQYGCGHYAVTVPTHKALMRHFGM